MPGPFIPLVQGDLTNVLYGPAGVVASSNQTVLFNKMAVCTVGDKITPHGNPSNAAQAGYNPVCGKAVIATGFPGVFVNKKPIAYVKSPCSCTYHVMAVKGAIGITLGKPPTT